MEVNRRGEASQQRNHEVREQHGLCPGHESLKKGSVRWRQRVSDHAGSDVICVQHSLNDSIMNVASKCEF